MPLGVRVREETGLENGIGGRLDTRHKVTGREGNLLDLGCLGDRESVVGSAEKTQPSLRLTEVVGRVLVESQLSNFP